MITVERNIDKLAADNIRILSVAMVENANSGHPGGPMGGADFMHILYSEFLNFDPDDMRWPHRDRFFLDAGHLSAMMYGQLAMFGKYSMDDIRNFRQWESVTPGHPELDVDRGIENTSGPLGQGHVMGIGAAVAEKFLTSRFGKWMDHKTYLFISDGGIQEEISQGAGRIAGHLGLGNVIMFFDSNDVQLSTDTDAVTSEDTAMKYKSWGWHVVTIDGHDHDQIRKALQECIDQAEKPSLIIGKTIMGKGAVDEDGKPYEGYFQLHGQPISKAGASYPKTVEALGGDAANPFAIFPGVSEHYEKAIERKREIVKERKSAEAEWRQANPEQAEKLDGFLSGKLPDIDYSSIETKEGGATREASSAVLGYLADHVENIIVSSADLSNSDKTDGLLKKDRAITKDDFGGRFIHAGVAEFTMANLANGMVLHGGVIPAVGTFFVFSDYMKPATRLAAIMGLPVIYVWTHDSFRVGEDGPTHQPIEHEAQIRLLEKVKNHAGNRSLLALRPGDAAETVVAWKMALENKIAPTALILSRQKVADIAPMSGDRLSEAMAAGKGAYLVKETEDPEVILVGNGSEVSTLLDAASILGSEIRANVVSVISEGLFREQPGDYQMKMIPDGIPVFGLTGGLTTNLSGLVGDNGYVHGVNHFGYSAPAGVLDEKLGFTGENIAGEIRKYLGK